MSIKKGLKFGDNLLILLEIKVNEEYVSTLESLIAVGVRLLIFGLFSSPYALIRHPTLIRFWYFDYCFT